VLSNPSLLKARIITYAEQEFILAEATIKGLITGDPQAHYLNGIRGAYAEWGIDPSKADNYLTNPNVALNLTDINKALEQIVTQKWILN
ncbi:SusD/RagB family nutrient-binding outer membrane lipoprotein, partial [Mycobacterium ulcerans]